MRRKIEFSTEINNVITDLVANKTIVNEIIEVLKDKYDFICSATTLKQQIKELGLDISSNKVRKPKLNKNQILFFRSLGKSVEDIASICGVQPQSISNYISDNNIDHYCTNYRMKQFYWENDEVCELQLIDQKELKNIESKLDCNLKSNAIVTVDGKPFKVDFYSDEYKIAFVHNGIGNAKLIDSFCEDMGAFMNQWFSKINSKKEIVLINYYFFDVDTTATFINNIMKKPYDLDPYEIQMEQYKEYKRLKEDDEIRRTGKLHNGVGRLLREYANRLNEELHIEEGKIKDDMNLLRKKYFTFENMMYDTDNNRLIDKETLIININPNTGELLTDKEKKNILDNINKYMGEEYSYYKMRSKNKIKIEQRGEDNWNYRCGRELYNEIMNHPNKNDILKF